MVTEAGVVAGYRLDDGESSFGADNWYEHLGGILKQICEGQINLRALPERIGIILKNQVVHLLREITGSDDQYCIAKNYLDGKITTVAFYRIPHERREAAVREYTKMLMFGIDRGKDVAVTVGDKLKREIFKVWFIG